MTEINTEQTDKVASIFTTHALSDWEQGLEIDQDKALGMITAFEKRTASMMNCLDDYECNISPEEIIDIKEEVFEYVKSALEESEIDNAVINNIVISGSRSRGIETLDSDLDVVVEIKFTDNNYVKEDSLFNILHDELSPLEIDGIPVDINPITEEKTGSLNYYLEQADEYLRNKAVQSKIEAIRNDLTEFLPQETANEILKTELAARYNIESEKLEQEYEEPEY